MQHECFSATSLTVKSSQERNVLLPGTETVQQVENARIVVVLSVLAIMFWWRVLLRALVILAALATVVGFLALIEMART
jgi:hypothetical protein